MTSQPLKRNTLARHRLIAAIASLAIASATLSSASAAFAASPAPQPHANPPVQTVAVVLTPFLTWDDIARDRSGQLNRFAAEGAIGNMNCTTADSWWPTVAGGVLTLGSGRWTAGAVDKPARPSALDEVQDANAGSLNPPDLGALGSVLHAAGLKTAAVGNGDEDTATPAGIRRPAALLACDANGVVDVDLTDPSLLVSDSAAPFGVRASGPRMADAVRTALAAHPALLVIDPGDLERAHDAPDQTAEQAAANHATAVARTAAILGNVSFALAGRPSLLMVVTPATDKPYYEPPRFGPTIVAGDGFHGELLSASTRRSGLVTNLDVAPTILSALWQEPTSTMIGQPMTSTDGSNRWAGLTSFGQLDKNIAYFAELGTSVGAVDYARDLLFLKAFCYAVILLIAFVSLVALVPAMRALAPIGRATVLFALAVPPGAWLLFAIDRYPATPARVLLAFGVATLAVFALVLTLSVALKRRPEVPLLAMSALTSLLICVDQWAGHPFETGIFSYSIRAGWRYYGMGNEGAALLVGASIIAVALACDLAENTAYARGLRVFLMPVVGVVALITAAAPFAGANVGVAIWGVVAFGVAWARINRLRVGWRTGGAIVVAVVALVAILAGIDMLSGGGETHIGRFFTEMLGGDFSAVRVLVVRKALNNIDYLPQTPYTWLVAGLVAGLAAVRWLGDRPLARMLADRPGVSAALLGLLVGGVAATLSEDSGVVMPALMLFAGALPVFALLLAEKPAQESLDPDVT